MVLGQRGIHPHTIAYDVGLGYGFQLLCSDIYVSACYQRVHPLGCCLHNTFVEWQLQLEQVL